MIGGLMGTHEDELALEVTADDQVNTEGISVGGGGGSGGEIVKLVIVMVSD